MLLSITTPQGIQPKAAKDLIGFQAAQTAENCKLTDGQLRPWNNYLFTELAINKGIIQTLYRYVDEYWFALEAEVDIVPAPVAGDTQDKIYYTGMGIPLKTNLDEATTGTGAMPINFFPLAVPSPKTALTSAASPPPAGTGEDRYVQYIWTVVTSWGEESFVSPASTELLTKNGEAVDLSAITMIWVTGTAYELNEVVFKTSAEGGTYMFICVQAGTTGGLEPTWNETVGGDTIDNTVRWRCYKNNLVSKRIYRLIVGETSATYKLVATINMNVTTYEDTIIDTLLGQICPTLNQDDGGSAEEDYDPPPQDLTGLIDFGYGMVMGFVGKDIYPSVPYKPWAFPIANSLSAPNDILCITPISDGMAAVFTSKGIHLLSGRTPAGLQLGKELPDKKPNLSKRGTKTYAIGAVYPASDGLRVITPDGQNELLTKDHYDVETFSVVHPETMHACIHNNKYFGFWQTATDEGGIVFDLISGQLTTLDFYTFATYVDPETDTMYFLRSNKMSVFNEIFNNPDAASTTGKATQFSLAAAGALAGIVQPDYARNVVYTITGTITSIQITVTGTLATGETEQTEVITAITSSVGNKAFSHIDSITVDSIVGGSGDTLDIGYGVKFGLANAIEAESDIFKTNMDDDDVAVSGHTISTTYSTITFATVPNATHDYQVWYTAE